MRGSAPSGLAAGLGSACGVRDHAEREAADGEPECGEKLSAVDRDDGGHGLSSSIPAARLIAARMRVYVPQRHRLPAIDASI